MMRSMTDFIDTVSNSERLAVYNEDYSWAEEYADYFNKESVNYVQPILESSEYQFFGETCFIQESSKRLLAGGILALLSGAFFMIMKLLNGGGGGGSSSSGSKSSSSSSNKTNNRSNNNNKPPTNPSSGRSAGQPQAQALQSEKLKAELQSAIKEKLKAQNDAFATAKAAEDERKRKALLEESERKAEEAKKAKEAAYVKPAELEAEEDLVFNSKIIIDELNKLKKQGYDETDVRNGHELQNILQGLEKIDEITDFLVKLVRDEHWDIFGSSVTEKGYAETFHKKYTELHEIAEKIKSGSSRINDENGSSHDISIDSVISDIKNIDKVTKDIESKCKEGMKLCKAERTKLINAKKDVSNVDKAYKILNGIIRDVNVVCKNIQTAFRTVHKALKSKNTPVTEFFKLIGDNGKRLEGALPNFELSKFKEIYQKADSNFNYDKSDEEAYINKVVDAIEKYVYGSDSKVGAEEWKKIESFLETIGFKSAGLSVGDKLTTGNRTLFAQPIPAKTDDSSKDMTIKQIQQQPRILKIEVDGNMETYKLAGKCTYWKVGKRSVDKGPNDVDAHDSMSNKKNTPVGNFYADIGKNMNKLEGVIKGSYLSELKKSYEKGLKMLNDPDDDEEDAFSEIYMSLRNVWKSQKELSNDNLKHLISFMNSIGFKEVNISKGQKLKAPRYFKDVWIEPTDDPSLDYVIKEIFEHPMEMNITLEDDNFHAILPGQASMYRVGDIK